MCANQFWFLYQCSVPSFLHEQYHKLPEASISSRRAFLSSAWPSTRSLHLPTTTATTSMCATNSRHHRTQPHTGPFSVHEVHAHNAWRIFDKRRTGITSFHLKVCFIRGWTSVVTMGLRWLPSCHAYPTHPWTHYLFLFSIPHLQALFAWHICSNLKQCVKYMIWYVLNTII